MKFSEISFAEIKDNTDKYNDAETAVVTGVQETTEENWMHFADFLCNIVGFSKGKNLIEVRRITGNVLGDEGRTDWLLVFDHPEQNFNPFGRLAVGDTVKWTSDFICNFREDYYA